LNFDKWLKKNRLRQPRESSWGNLEILIPCQVVQKYGNLTKGARPVLADKRNRRFPGNKKQLVGADPLIIINPSIRLFFHPSIQRRKNSSLDAQL